MSTDKKISELTEAITVQYDDTFVCVQGGITKRCSSRQIKNSFMQVFGEFFLNGTITKAFSQPLGLGASSYEVVAEFTLNDSLYLDWEITKIDENGIDVTVNDDGVFGKIICYLIT
jgi:hypothetical protein